MIAGAWNSTRDADESRLVWKHLRVAGLLKGPSDATSASYQQPVHAFGGKVGFAEGLYNLSGTVIVFGALPGEVDRRIETHADDGSPSSGTIQGNARLEAYESTTRYDLAFRF